MGLFTRFLTVAFFRSRIYMDFIFTSVFMTGHTSSLLFTMLVDGETGGSKGTHNALPVCRPFHCLAL